MTKKPTSDFGNNTPWIVIGFSIEESNLNVMFNAGQDSILNNYKLAIIKALKEKFVAIEADEIEVDNITGYVDIACKSFDALSINLFLLQALYQEYKKTVNVLSIEDFCEKNKIPNNSPIEIFVTIDYKKFSVTHIKPQPFRDCLIGMIREPQNFPGLLPN